MIRPLEPTRMASRYFCKHRIDRSFGSILGFMAALYFQNPARGTLAIELISRGGVQSESSLGPYVRRDCMLTISAKSDSLLHEVSRVMDTSEPSSLSYLGPLHQVVQLEYL
jgi:hypothetical protein